MSRSFYRHCKRFGWAHRRQCPIPTDPYGPTLVGDFPAYPRQGGTGDR